ncbi:MAG: hypothetical protein ACR652_25155 [Methylocystis sp.]|uniref:hypothetical protein n=1 Tax=Methylocystis sp. TaxID=1911079 RepID=UPI003DA2C66E
MSLEHAPSRQKRTGLVGGERLVKIRDAAAMLGCVTIANNRTAGLARPDISENPLHR